MKKAIIAIAVLMFAVLSSSATAQIRMGTMEDGKPIYNASKFGVRSDGVTMNTRSIQKGIDWISEHGGGVLRFWVGQYLTGSIHLKSNVTIELMEGATITGSTNPWDYDQVKKTRNYALVIAEEVENVQIIGKGNIHGNGRELGNNFVEACYNGFIDEKLVNDRVNNRARLLYFREVKNLTIKDITLRDASDWVQTYDQCEQVCVDHVFVESCAYWNNDGIDIVDCNGFVLKNSYINSSDDAICLKSHDKNALCQNIEVRNCTARSSASGIKFGTADNGGFKNIRIINNVVYDTHRSAITIQSVDGGICEDILVDSLYATNTSNPIYLTVGQRHGDKTSTMKNITIRNLYCEVPATKADTQYEYEGPIEDNPRNISPCGIIGMPGSKIANVTLENIEIVFPGGGDKHVAYRGLDQLDDVPEMPKAYPEFSQHKELPAWGFYIRHVDGITMKNIKLTALKSDYRTAIVMDDVANHTIKGLEVKEPAAKGKDSV